ncbi:hypothetical protein LSM04_006768 [Trypanosoma melophagium]|uniref:uncharacterized protein n=1 Tax=Trypanosoma melophagium TaxID=715481 RepID=UPI003519FAFA|nr:hypothetical protein LSM04_000276 [Trypanosoma melophagium]KAH9601659.1 hypothetical protein LSM04_005711 [Trypanosoma melophagium]KAH9601730.1 hypothetical protein LSM04_006768 [Trypanosoma melophagium]
MSKGKKDEGGQLNSGSSNIIRGLVGLGAGLVFGAIAGYMLSCFAEKNEGNDAENPQEIPEEVDSISTMESGRCSVCMERQARTLYLPCRHLATCATCAREIHQRGPRRCPMCNQYYTEKSTVYTT